MSESRLSSAWPTWASRFALLALSWTFSLASTDVADAETRNTNPEHSDLTAARRRAVVQYTESLALLEALTQRRGTGNHQHPLYVVLGSASKTQPHLCLVEKPRRPKHCDSVDQRPAVEASAPCVWCDEQAKDAAFDTYVRLDLSVHSLRRLQALYEQSDAAGRFDALAQLIVESLSSTAGEPNVEAISVALRELSAAKSAQERGRALEQRIAATLTAAKLSLTPDDVSTEGGLRAAIKLAETAQRRAQTQWQTAFAEWASCRTDATDNGKLPSGDRRVVERCNERRHSAAEPSARQRLLEWQRAADRQRICLETNRTTALSVARYQASPCPLGHEP